jgi:cell shape-determining protein MreC
MSLVVALTIIYIALVAFFLFFLGLGRESLIAISVSGAFFAIVLFLLLRRGSELRASGGLSSRQRAVEHEVRNLFQDLQNLGVSRAEIKRLQTRIASYDDYYSLIERLHTLRERRRQEQERALAYTGKSIEV